MYGFGAKPPPPRITDDPVDDTTDDTPEKLNGFKGLGGSADDTPGKVNGFGHLACHVVVTLLSHCCHIRGWVFGRLAYGVRGAHRSKRMKRKHC